VAAAPPAAPPVKQVETFTIATQTEDDDFPPESEQDEEETPEVNGEKQPDTEEDTKKEEVEVTVEPKVLSAEEMEEQVASAPFSSFLNTTSKKVERLLGEPVLADLFVNYVGETDGIEPAEKVSDGSKYVSAREVYECAKWTATRDVTDMDWSPLHRELMLSSYHMPSSHSSSLGSAALSAVSPDDTPSASLAPRSGELQSDGLALVWSLAMPSRPEHIFTCGSPVLASRFHPTEAPLVIGGCQSGQLVVWDVRAGRLPVQRSSMSTMVSSKGHAYPICAMEIVEGGVSVFVLHAFVSLSHSIFMPLTLLSIVSLVY
jgi:dynein intermediate chain